MAYNLSTAEFNGLLFGMSEILRNGDWNDRVAESYSRFIDEESRVVSEMDVLLTCAYKAYSSAASVDADHAEFEYYEMEKKWRRLQNGA